MRVFVERDLGQSHLVQHFEGQIGPLLRRGADAMNAHRLGQGLADDHARVQGRVRVLKNDLDPALVIHELPCRHGKDILALEQGLARRCLVQTHQRQANGGLARARFADQAQRFAFGQLERDILDRLSPSKNSFARIKVFSQVTHVEDDGIGGVDAALALVQMHGVAVAGHEILDDRQPDRSPVQTRPA